MGDQTRVGEFLFLERCRNRGMLACSRVQAGARFVKLQARLRHRARPIMADVRLAKGRARPLGQGRAFDLARMRVAAGDGGGGTPQNQPWHVATDPVSRAGSCAAIICRMDELTSDMLAQFPPVALPIAPARTASVPAVASNSRSTLSRKFAGAVGAEDDPVFAPADAPGDFAQNNGRAALDAQAADFMTGSLRDAAGRPLSGLQSA